MPSARFSSLPSGRHTDFKALHSNQSILQSSYRKEDVRNFIDKTIQRVEQGLDERQTDLKKIADSKNFVFGDNSYG
jgi:cell division septum initiation protein DivIVA